MEKELDELIKMIVKNEVALKELTDYIRSEKFSRLSDRKKTAIELQGKVMDELSAALRNRIISYMPEGEEDNGEY